MERWARRRSSAQTLALRARIVPDRRLGASGAQPPEILADLLRRGWEPRPTIGVVADGPTCGPDGS